MKEFKLRFQEYKDSIKGSNSLYEESFLYWLNNYVNQKNTLNPSNFLSGKIYSFEYIDILEKKKFINKRPIVLFTEFFNTETRASFGGIDLILIPPIKRIFLLEVLQSVYQKQIEENIARLERGNILDQFPLKMDYKILDSILKDFKWKNAYRAWDLKKIRDIKEIPYEDWTKIVYLHTRSIEGIPIEEIYNKNSEDKWQDL